MIGRSVGIWWMVFAGTVTTAAHAALTNPFPAARFLPDAVGLLYPGFTVAAGVNPAALPSAGHGTAIQLGFSPPPSGGATQLFAGIANSKSNLAFGAGYQSSLMSGTLQHNAFAGLGGSFGNFSLGLGLRDYNLSTGLSPSIDTGVVIDLKVIDLGLVFYDLNGAARMGVGVGTRGGSRFNLEADVLLPPFSSLGSSYLFTVSAQMSVGIFGVHFRTSYDTGIRDITHTVALGVWFVPSFQVVLQYSTPQRLVGAVTFVF